jgi:spermidine dehydrogenase
MLGPRRNDHGDEALGVDRRIDRRDFLNSTLLASGSLLLSHLTPADLMAQNDDWTGYGGVGDYRNSNGNTEAVMNEAHKIRDHIFDTPPANAVDTRETFDCVIVGGGLSGLAAALFFNREAGPRLNCLVLDNHPVFGGEAKRNEFIVDGHRLFAQQGSTHFQIPYPHSYLERFYQSIGMDYGQFKYQTWGSSDHEIPLSRSPYQMLAIEPSTYGFYFGAKFGQKPGMWLVDPWGRNLEGAPLSPRMCAELLKWHQGANPSAWPPKLPFDYPGDEVSRRYDSKTLEQVMMEEDGLSQETIRTFFAQDTAGGFGLGPDALSGYCKFVWDAFYALDDTPTTGWQMFPGGNAGMARLMVKTLIPDSIPGPRTLENVCRNSINFAALDRAGNPARIRLQSTVVRVEHEREPGKSQLVWITYTRGGSTYRVKARSVVMAGGSWTTKHIVRDLPSSHREAYAQFYRTPYMVVNVAMRNWRFLYKLGISGGRWFEGLGNWTEVRKVVTFATDQKTIAPDSPTVLTLYVAFLYPGLSPEEQGAKGRAELLSTPYREYERRIREQFDDMFSRSGFDPKRDIAGIILNRWGHAFCSPQPGFFFGKDGKPAPREVLRSAPFGRIAFSNTDLAGSPDHRTAITESDRAVGQLLDRVLT